MIRPLNFLGQCAIFTLSPLIVPSMLCSCLLLMSLLNGALLEMFSIPVVFSMVLGCIPAAFIGLCSALMRQALRFNNPLLNRCLWLGSTILLSAWVTAKFMSGISVHVVNLAYVMGAISAMIACGIILVIERYRQNIFLSRFYYQP